jgi:hypothetical protein
MDVSGVDLDRTGTRWNGTTGICGNGNETSCSSIVINFSLTN